ncbi:unnamed protein product [Rotaria sp. Silwood1]|nr:unnamed protein product [Rotaria sp. Silwood1]CAF1621124.1 unnamed protein product [Rotaria sp. Silwood1]CAF3768550.1 unnamed protein product [Rotaria sp. Silwood1]CAF3783106.1 unnamed protein product [Rotaria sp. Silwood1]CAF4946875.1 unnamed protein product [Rotaria sp. Silwood1]
MGVAIITVRVQLPADVSCNHCVFQWKYTAGNSWGTDPITGEQGLGKGTENETFMGCADIKIGGSTESVPPPVVATTSNPSSSTPRTSTAGSSSALPWQYLATYKIGDQVTFEGKTYSCLQGHTAWSYDWRPSIAASLWKLI